MVEAAFSSAAFSMETAPADDKREVFEGWREAKWVLRTEG
jgi:hypothetical protein